ncbi:methylated-DNA--[protein]-cysteine S-methyltransferase [Gehongia tenuis]|uniref:Methylated-DNA--protein-cysteine methyltransferase n=1 Tax=Gehongia tenuis TaxID=2763655 RepID=A0A926D760_9FIRM|nr:methylated-DNA--[protein]-cysteine S-methyltransferase [Gehongia tenuis]MBC8532094.1 methylated-DNA--[protein]-cysteine S-methyltransferase [Gehongia tenuis]
MAKLHVVQQWIPSPIGPLLLLSSEKGIVGLDFSMEPVQKLIERGKLAVDGEGDPFHAESQLFEYFNRSRRVFELPLHMVGTPFQTSVWRELTLIPYGHTISYRKLAQRVGSPQGFRAVGAANGRNPIPIIVPCHRVINHNGALGGYGGGLDRKKFLLRLEGIPI